MLSVGLFEYAELFVTCVLDLDFEFGVLSRVGKYDAT